MTSPEFIEMLQDSGFDPESYSGRGMYGKECVCVKDASIWEVARALPEDANIPCPSTDQLGRGIVMYWPHYEWPEGGAA